jgi:superfamily II DNA or RNA helicase
MVLLDICEIPVEFPFQPYDSQVIYMEKVIMSLKNKQNAILESPTGTGKVVSASASVSCYCAFTSLLFFLYRHYVYYVQL